MGLIRFSRPAISHIGSEFHQLEPLEKTMNRRIALAAMALLTTMSFAHGYDLNKNFEGLAGSYKEKTGGEVKIRKADDAKKEAGPWRFMLLNGSTPGDWACAQGEDNKGEGKTSVFFIEFSEGPFKGSKYNIVRGKDGKVKELEEVGGRKTIWERK
jgi:hypothetical protein